LAIPYASEDPTAFISCGTWSLVGTESDEPVVTDEAFASGLTNEGCFDGKYRLLQNTTGMWIIQELQRDWRLQGEEVGFGEMVTLAEEVTDNQTWKYPPGQERWTDIPVTKYCQLKLELPFHTY